MGCRAEATAVLRVLVAQSADVQKVLAFEGAFEKLFQLVAAENGVDGGAPVRDALLCVDALLRFNGANQVRALSTHTVRGGRLTARAELLPRDAVPARAVHAARLPARAPRARARAARVRAPVLGRGQGGERGARAPPRRPPREREGRKRECVRARAPRRGALTSGRGACSRRSSRRSRGACLRSRSAATRRSRSRHRSRRPLAARPYTDVAVQALTLLPATPPLPLLQLQVTAYMPVPETAGEEWDRLEPSSALDALVELLVHGEYAGQTGAASTRGALALRTAALGVFEVCSAPLTAQDND
jgi:hypothetical protein